MELCHRPFRTLEHKWMAFLVVSILLLVVSADEIVSFSSNFPTRWELEHLEKLQQTITRGLSQQPRRNVDWYRSHCQNLTLLAKDHRQASFQQFSELKRALLCHQNPPDCSKVSYVIYHDLKVRSGIGWGAFLEMYHLLWALDNNRIFVEVEDFPDDSKSFNPKLNHWRWCSVGPQSHSCYFESWSKCSSYVHEHSSVAEARYSDYSPSSKFWHVKGTDDFPKTWRKFPADGPGFFWHMGLFSEVFYQPLPWVVDDAASFMRRSNIDRNDNFIVAHVRWAGKATEKPLLPLQDYFEPIKSLLKCTKSIHVLIQSETQTAIEKMLEWCNQNNFHGVYTVNPRAGADVWNQALVPPNNSSMDPKLRLMTEAYVAIRNFIVGSKAVGFIGTLNSAWVKIQLGGMLASNILKQKTIPVNFRPPVVIGLRNQSVWLQNAYTGQYTSFLTDHFHPNLWNCPADSSSKKD